KENIHIQEAVINMQEEQEEWKREEFEVNNKRQYTGTSRTTIWRKKKEKELKDGVLTNIQNQTSVDIIQTSPAQSLTSSVNTVTQPQNPITFINTKTQSPLVHMQSPTSSSNFLPRVLNDVFVITICKFACKSWRYMDAYNKGLVGRSAE
ncbi:16385_t:CDS:2, partial [Funneliformis caledonium]